MWRLLAALGWGARKRFRLGPYERRYSAKATERGLQVRRTGHSLVIGRLRIDLQRRVWTYDTPGPGGIGPRPLPRWLGGRR